MHSKTNRPDFSNFILLQ